MTGKAWGATIQDLAGRFRDRDAADSDTYPAENIADLKGCGLLVAPLTPEHGGSGARLPEMVEVIELLAAASPSTALLTAMPLGLAGIFGLGAEIAPEVHRAAWAEQVERVAAEMREGLIYAACNSEKGAGGSIAAMKTIAERNGDGTFLLTGEKILASFGHYADYFFSAAKVRPEDLPGAGVVELFRLRTDAPGVEILSDWDGFGMRSTESHTVRYASAPATELLGFPDFLATVQPLTYWYCLFAAIPLGCARAILHALATPEPESPGLRLRLSEALMRYEALRAYLLETSDRWRPAAGPEYAARVLRTKTYVSQEATKLCAELFALGGGRHYRRDGELARLLASSFAGTALRPPLSLAVDQLTQSFSLGDLDGG